MGSLFVKLVGVVSANVAKVVAHHLRPRCRKNLRAAAISSLYHIQAQASALGLARWGGVVFSLFVLHGRSLMRLARSIHHQKTKVWL